MLKKIKLLFSTVKYLKLTQVKYQLFYRVIRPRRLGYYDGTFVPSNLTILYFSSTPPVRPMWLEKFTFVFLNLRMTFDKGIDWACQKHGKLWNYNLQYADYLFQENKLAEEKEVLIKSLYGALTSGVLPLEPYPASLRSINVIRFCSMHGSNDELLLKNLHSELDFISKRPEYHLLGNHLLENSFALLMGGAFFSEPRWIHQGKRIIIEQLDEQILDDGAHFELSPMYHQIIYFRLLELIDWYSKWCKDEDFHLEFFIRKAQLMRSWLENISFRNGDIPHFNDSAREVAYSSSWLLKYSDQLGVDSSEVPLGSSGYRAVNKGVYECRVDFGQVGPSYQPGHAHADALSFIVYYKNVPLIVEYGTSTYQQCKVRSLERSTSAHNTVVVGNINQSDVWSAFRVAERAIVKILKDGDEISAEHDGYKKLGIIHTRVFSFEANLINITDTVVGNSGIQKEFHLHIAPNLMVEQEDAKFYLGKDVIIEFNEYKNYRIENYQMADGFNRYKTAQKIIVTFEVELITSILFKK